MKDFGAVHVGQRLKSAKQKIKYQVHAKENEKIERAAEKKMAGKCINTFTLNLSFFCSVRMTFDRYRHVW